MNPSTEQVRKIERLMVQPLTLNRDECRQDRDLAARLVLKFVADMAPLDILTAKRMARAALGR